MTTASSATEEYLQAIYTLDDEGAQVIGARLATFLGVSPAAVSEMLHRLERDGLVTLDDRRAVRLVGEGKAIAERIARRHRLAERMLLLSFPRDRLLVRVVMRVVNASLWLMGRSFRAFVHPRASLYEAAQGEGFVVAETGRAIAWEFAALRRARSQSTA